MGNTEEVMNSYVLIAHTQQKLDYHVEAAEYFDKALQIQDNQQ